MEAIKSAMPKLSSIFLALLPVGLWTMLWFSLFAGDIRSVFHWTSPLAFVHGLRATFPLVAGVLAISLISAKLARQGLRGHLFFGPLGLTVIYGLVGIGASLASPNSTVALYWAAAYLSVPLVLWALAWGSAPAYDIRRLINYNWVFIISLTVALFAIAVLYLDLGKAILTPSILSTCSLEQSWLSATKEVIRPTGVGRIAAIAGILALTNLWHGRGRALWLPILVASVALLFTSGARTSIFGFAAAAGFMWLIQARKVAMIAMVGLIAIAPIIWYTGVADEFLKTCFFRSWVDQSDAATAARLSVQQDSLPVEQPGPDVAAPNQATAGDSVQNRSPSQEPEAIPSPPRTSRPSKEAESGSEGLNSPGGSAISQGLPVNATSGQVSQGEDGSEPRFLGLIPRSFFRLTGRTAVWGKGWELTKESPLWGYGFHADRLLLRTHMHNTYMHALIQTGFAGTIPLLAALILTWALFIRVLRKLGTFPMGHRQLIIQTGGLLAFLSLRTIPESPGAFFGVDWLILGPLLLYLQTVDRATFAGGPQE